MKENKQLDAKKKLIQLGQTVLERRYHILTNSIQKSLIDIYRLQEIRNSFINYQQNLAKLSYDMVTFQVSLIINGSKCFEAFSNDNHGQKRFRYSTQSFIETIENNTLTIIKALLFKVNIQPFKNKEVIDQAVQNIKTNYTIARLIAGKQLTRQKLDEFLSMQQYNIFEIQCEFNNYYLQGLSSFDGKIVYIHKEYISKDFFINEPNMAKRELLWLIEYQLLENLSRWSSTLHILSISAERNTNLQLENNQMVGSGSFYLEKVYKFQNTQNPFYLNHKFQQIPRTPQRKQNFK